MKRQGLRWRLDPKDQPFSILSNLQ